MSNFVMLLVEDDDFQRVFLAELLREEGFEVVECATGEAAELVVASAGPELKALITDNNLAGRMTGVELAAYAKEHCPQLNIIIMSGMPLAAPDQVTFLHKPFLPAHFIDAVRQN